MSIGKNIKTLRKMRKLTQVELANKANISRSYLADVEGDRYNPSVETLKTIADALSVQTSDLLGDSENAVKLLDILSLLTDREGYFLAEYREDILRAIADSGLNMAFANSNARYYERLEDFFTGYFDSVVDTTTQEYSDSVNLYNEAYETRTIKLAFQHNREEVQEAFLEELSKIMYKYNIKPPVTHDGSGGSDEFDPTDILNKKIVVDGKEIVLTTEQREKLLKLTLAALDAVR